MEKIFRSEKKTVGLAQTGSGWNVSTYSVKGNKVKRYKNQNFRTLAAAKKGFTQQKAALGGKPPRRKPKRRRPRNNNPFGLPRFGGF